MLYPLKFKPRLKELIWGGDKLAKAGKKPSPKANPEKIGESWEVSGVPGDISVVANGFLKNNNLQELIEVYMGDLVGDSVYEKYGLEFPVLVKFIDAHDVLSVQVHPDDALAEKRHNSRGKTEMWYVVDAEPGGFLYVGFKRELSREEYAVAVESGSLSELLERYEVKKGDVYFIPAGTVHAIGRGVLIAEIQETSNITYRIDDWGRVGKDGKPRQLHTELAIDAIDFSVPGDRRISVSPAFDADARVVSCPHFTVNLLNLEEKIVRDYAPLDSFVIYLCTEGSCRIVSESGEEQLSALESILIPAEETEITLYGKATLLEVYIDSAESSSATDRH